jgi:hypothetical protein
MDWKYGSSEAGLQARCPQFKPRYHKKKKKKRVFIVYNLPLPQTSSWFTDSRYENSVSNG